MNVLIHLLLAWLTALVPYTGQHHSAHVSRAEARVSLCHATSAEQWLIDRESSGNVHATNGDHFGLGQLTSHNRWQYGREIGVAPDTSSRCGQLRLMRAYVDDRYQSTANAVAWWKEHGWY